MESDEGLYHWLNRGGEPVVDTGERDEVFSSWKKLLLLFLSSLSLLMRCGWRLLVIRSHVAQVLLQEFINFHQLAPCNPLRIVWRKIV